MSKIKDFKMDKATIIRSLVLLIALINQGLVAFGLSPVPFSTAEIESGLAMVFTAGATLWAWWKNNDVTPEAKQATKHMNALKTKKKRKEDVK